MGRTTVEHELVIDVLDDLVVYCYAYEGELAADAHLGHLKALAVEVASNLAEDLNCLIFLEPREKEEAIIRVMNGLQRAIHDGAPPEEVDFGQAWTNKPPRLTGQFLHMVHIEQGSSVLQFVTDVIGRIETAFPPEAKQFITREQVNATVRAMLQTKAKSFTVPVHVDTLAGLLHQGFLMALEVSELPSVSPLRWHAMTRKYMQRAEKKLVEMVRDAFVTGMVRQLFSRAQKLHISIDRYYSWGALWKEPMPIKDCLNLYAQLNLSGAVVDVKFTRQTTKSPEAGIPADRFIRWGAARCPRAIESSRATAQIYFNTDDVNIRIDGKAIQKYAVMAIRYDKPLGDVEKDLRHFGIYLLNQRKRYCANGQESLSVGEDVMARHMTVDAIGQRKATRVVLHDKSSVLGHICALISLQMKRDPQYAGMSKKAQMLTIQDLVQDAGFTYGMESIRKVCARQDKEIAAIRLHLTKA